MRPKSNDDTNHSAPLIPLFFVYGWFDLFMLFPIISLVLTCIFLFFTFRGIFGQGILLTSVKTLASYILGYLMFFLTLGILGLIVGVVMAALALV